jgi:hydrogenase-4 component H/formate hydrogenlyase subunit 6
MRFAALLRDVIYGAIRRPVTERYPFSKKEVPARARGMLDWRPEACTGCGLCVLDCPAEAIELITIDKETHHFQVRYHIDRCTFCGQCVFSCRFNCLELVGQEWELAYSDKRALTVLYDSQQRDADGRAQRLAPDSK